MVAGSGRPRRARVVGSRTSRSVIERNVVAGAARGLRGVPENLRVVPRAHRGPGRAPRRAPKERLDEEHRDSWRGHGGHDDGQQARPRALVEGLAHHGRRSRRRPRLPARAALPAVRRVPRAGHPEAPQAARGPPRRRPAVRNRAHRAGREPRVPRWRRARRVRSARRRHGEPHPARGDAGAHRRGLEEDRVRLLHAGGRARASRQARALRGRTFRRRCRRDAHQVPRGAARAHFPCRSVFHAARHSRQGRDGLRDTAGGRVHQAEGVRHARRSPGPARDPGRAGLRGQQRGRRPARAEVVRRPRGAVRSARHSAHAWRRGGHRALGDGGRRRLAPHRQAHPARAGSRERVRARRRDRSALVQGGSGRALPVRGAVREHPAPRGRAGAPAGVRRARELLHRDRLRQGDVDRFQLHDRAAAGALSAAGDRALHAARGERHEPLGQARLQVDLLERAAGRERDAARPPHADGRKVELIR